MRFYLFITFIVSFSALAGSFDPKSRTDIENVSSISNAKLDFRYATPDNFMKKNVYGDFKQCYLQKIAAQKLRQAAQLLAKRKPGWKLLLFDCLRPHSVQKIMWTIVGGTPQEKYVANPDKGSMHNFGFAVDLSLADEKGKEVDMGTPFDFFGIEAEPEQENQLLKQGRLTQHQLDNRQILRTIMSESGFIPLPTEWWHFDALEKDTVLKDFKIVE
jgi:D-alanyl-D-alanine dipeptidase